MERVHPRVHQVGYRVGWLLLEADDGAGRVELHDPSSGGSFGMKDRQRRDRAVFPVRLDQ